MVVMEFKSINQLDQNYYAMEVIDKFIKKLMFSDKCVLKINVIEQLFTENACN